MENQNCGELKHNWFDYMDEQYFRDLISFGKEGRNLEYKQSTSWALADFKAKISKTVLAMANLRDGGNIVIGMKEEPDEYIAEGMIEDDFSSYDEDNLRDHISNYADPSVDFSVYKVEIDKRKFVFIIVREFEEIPVICKRDGPTDSKLFNGKMYCRPRRKPESIEVPSQTEMREIIELTVEKIFRKHYRMIPTSKIETGPTDIEQYTNQAGDFG